MRGTVIYLRIYDRSVFLYLQQELAYVSFRIKEKYMGWKDVFVAKRDR